MGLWEVTYIEERRGPDLEGQSDKICMDPLISPTKWQTRVRIFGDASGLMNGSLRLGTEAAAQQCGNRFSSRKEFQFDMLRKKSSMKSPSGWVKAK